MKIVNHRLLHDDDSPYPFIADNKNFFGTRIPLFLIMHYTAGTSAQAAINVLSDPRPDNPSRAVSAHLVIGRDGQITQLVSFDKVAWHAGMSYWEGKVFLNSYSIGIEMDNEGYLKKLDDHWMFKGTPTAYTDDQVLEATHWKHFKPYGWVRYPEAQYQAALEVAKALVDTYRLQEVLGHEDIHIAKVDPGPAFPMGDFRQTLLGHRVAQFVRYETRRVAAVYKNVDNTAPRLLPRLTVNPIPAGTLVDVLKVVTVEKKTVVELPPKKGEKAKPGKITLKTKIPWSLVKVLSEVQGSKNFTGWVLKENIDNKKSTLLRTVEIYKDVGANPGFGHPVHSASPLPQGLPVRVLSIQGKWALVLTLQSTPRFKFLEGWVYFEDLQLAPGG